MNDASIQKTGSRNRAIDFIKTIACIGVICLHTIRRDSGTVNYWLYYFSGLAIPLFTMSAGFFLFRKKEKITLAYTARKIGGIFFFCLCWVTIAQVISAARSDHPSIRPRYDQKNYGNTEFRFEQPDAERKYEHALVFWEA